MKTVPVNFHLLIIGLDAIEGTTSDANETT
jgi:hypothetical protein